MCKVVIVKKKIQLIFNSFSFNSSSFNSFSTPFHSTPLFFYNSTLLLFPFFNLSGCKHLHLGGLSTSGTTRKGSGHENPLQAPLPSFIISPFSHLQISLPKSS